MWQTEDDVVVSDMTSKGHVANELKSQWARGTKT